LTLRDVPNTSEPLSIGVASAAPAGRCALTFDDGPDAIWTPRLLDVLLATGAVATFFVMADRASDAPHVIERMRAEGHDIEFHCLRHVRHSALSHAAVHRDTVRGLAILAELGVTARRWRPPWGDVTQATRAVAADHALEIVLWSVDSEDWDGARAAVLHERVLQRLSEHAVVLLHDGVGPGARRVDCRETIDLITPLLEAMNERRLRPMTLTELCA